MNDLNCPYCGAGLEVEQSDIDTYDDACKYEMECSACEKSFVFTAQISIDYTPHKADCLNDSDYDYRETKTIPKVFAVLECTMCGDQRPVPDRDERIVAYLKVAK